MCAAQGTMRLIGYEQVAGVAEPQAVTQSCAVIAPSEAVSTPAFA
jgi:hypothetical protein